MTHLIFWGRPLTFAPQVECFLTPLDSSHLSSPQKVFGKRRGNIAGYWAIFCLWHSHRPFRFATASLARSLQLDASSWCRRRAAMPLWCVTVLKINQTSVKKKKKCWGQRETNAESAGDMSNAYVSRCLLLRVFLAVSLQKLPVFFHVKLLQMLSDTGRVVRLGVLGVCCFDSKTFPKHC